ncbi:MAG: hypothetical protein KAH38_12120, partial [Candidatus Hydrogenedentes bacterium]|nr:hypothetical protein [Candidatus Hydrogenedentota bacterium]
QQPLQNTTVRPRHSDIPVFSALGQSIRPGEGCISNLNLRILLIGLNSCNITDFMVQYPQRLCTLWQLGRVAVFAGVGRIL